MTYFPPLLPDGRKRSKMVKLALPLILPPDEFFNGVCAGVRRKTLADAACITFVDHKRVYVRAGDGIGELYDPEKGMSPSESFCVNVVASGTSLVVADTRKHPKLAGCSTVGIWGAWIGVPFKFQELLVGAVSVLTSEPRQWSPADLIAVQDAAELITRELAVADSLKGEWS